MGTNVVYSCTVEITLGDTESAPDDVFSLPLSVAVLLLA